MKIGMLGAGDIARGVAKYSLEQGHEVVLCNHSGPATPPLPPQNCGRLNLPKGVA